MCRIFAAYALCTEIGNCAVGAIEKTSRRAVFKRGCFRAHTPIEAARRQTVWIIFRWLLATTLAAQRRGGWVVAW
jgi:hypothetical protein